MTKMPEKDPNLLQMLADVWSAAHVFVYTAAVAGIRIYLDDKERVWPRVVAEMVLCGLLAQGAAEFVLFAFKWDVPVAVAASVGMLGPTYLRLKLKEIVSRKKVGG